MLRVIFFNAEGVGNIHVGHADVFVVGVFPHDRRHVGGHFAEPVEVIPGKEKFGFAPFLLQRAHHEITRGDISEISDMNGTRGRNAPPRRRTPPFRDSV